MIFLILLKAKKEHQKTVKIYCSYGLTPTHSKINKAVSDISTEYAETYRYAYFKA